MGSYPGPPRGHYEFFRGPIDGWRHLPKTQVLSTSFSDDQSVTRVEVCSANQASSDALHVARDVSQCTSEYVEECKGNMAALSQSLLTSTPWPCPSHAIAPLPQSFGRMSNPYVNRPAWFNSPATCAVLPNLVQVGATCGLHAVCHLLHSAEMLERCLGHPMMPSQLLPNRAEFEATGLAACPTNVASSLIQPGGSNYDIAILMACV